LDETTGAGSCCGSTNGGIPTEVTCAETKFLDESLTHIPASCTDAGGEVSSSLIPHSLQ
jgi:hypothetical protein